jgi:hypothetical protein
MSTVSIILGFDKVFLILGLQYQLASTRYSRTLYISHHIMFSLLSSFHITPLSLLVLPLLVSLAPLTAADAADYSLPSGGVASTTQFYLGPELSGGTARGVRALPNGKSTSGRQGGGPGYLYIRGALFTP